MNVPPIPSTGLNFGSSSNYGLSAPIPGLNTPMAPMAPQMQPQTPVVPQVPTLPTNPPVASMPAPSVAPQQQPTQAPRLAQVSPRSPIDDTEIDKTPTEQLTPAQKTYLASVAETNAKIAGKPATTRAVGAATMEKFIQDNKDTFAPRLKNAAEYAGALGRGKEYADKLSGKNPEALQDYTWVNNDFIPQLTNNVRIMEKLSVTPFQQKQVNEMTAAAFKWYQSPDTAITYINKNFDMFGREAQAALDAAQPYKKGVLEKMYGLNTNSGDYIGNNKGAKDYSKMSTEDLMRIYQGGK